MSKEKVTKEEKAPVPATEQKSTDVATWPFGEWNRLMESFFPTNFLRHWREEWPMSAEWFPSGMTHPRVDISETEKEVFVHAELPGVAKENVEVFVEPRKLTVRGKTEHEEEKKEETYYRKEIRRGSFSRVVALPTDVDPEKVNATFKDGILELKMAKKEPTQRRSVQIS